MTYQRITVEQAQSLIKQGPITLLDIRDPASFAADHIDQAIHTSNDNVEEIVASADKQQPLVIYCYHGNSSQGAADYFYSLGFHQSYSVDGGFEEWKLKR